MHTEDLQDLADTTLLHMSANQLFPSHRYHTVYMWVCVCVCVCLLCLLDRALLFYLYWGIYPNIALSPVTRSTWKFCPLYLCIYVCRNNFEIPYRTRARFRSKNKHVRDEQLQRVARSDISKKMWLLRYLVKRSYQLYIYLVNSFNWCILKSIQPNACFAKIEFSREFSGIFLCECFYKFYKNQNNVRVFIEKVMKNSCLIKNLQNNEWNKITHM